MDKVIRLLVLEDNPGDVLLLRSVLDCQGSYEVFEASTVLEAKAALSHRTFDVAFVDLSLPDSHGLSTVDALRAAAPDLPIIVLTGDTDEKIALDAVSRGAQDYLLKGQTSAATMTRTIRHAIDRKQAEISLQRARDDLEILVQERTADLLRANQILQMTAECSHALVHVSDEATLADVLCGIFHGRGGYRLVRVAFAGEDEDGNLKLVASAGGSEDAGDGSRAACECSCGPTAQAVRTGRVLSCGDLLAESLPASWREFASTAGVRSVVAFPLMSEGRAFGALSVFSEEKDAFDDANTATLRPLADDLAFGITALRDRAQRDSAELALKHRASQLRALASELTQAEQRERRRLAQVLHDCLQQLLVGAKYTVFTARSKTKSKPLLEAMDQLSHILDESIEAARSLTCELSPPIFHAKGLAAGLKWLGQSMKEKHGLQIEVEADPAAEPPSEPLRVFMYEAVRELLFNVVKHAKVKRARVRLYREREEVRLEVLDLGVGFHVGRQGAKDALTGGLGLFGIRERLGYFGGHMTIDTTPGKGSSITLAAKAQPAGDASGDSDATAVCTTCAALHPEKKTRVLIADDHAIVRQGLGSLLRGESEFEIVGEATNGQEAVEMARQLRPDVVVMDVSMPRLNGCDATRIIAAELPLTRVIGLSMHAEAEIGAAMLRAGAVAFLTKGGPTEALFAALRSPARKLEPARIKASDSLAAK